ncbi:unannotated protein [freshwater metagenome]|uniref:Unannotated protein n=1 Tax=freshwater metagenome TaxID=449393 RepID=A0A6J7GQP5_9ZZZZ
MRGTASRASAVMSRSASESSSSGRRAGLSRLINVVPDVSLPISPGVGAFTLSTMSHDQASAAPTMRAPASSYCASGKADRDPAPCSTTTSYPRASNLPTVSGVAATRVSPEPSLTIPRRAIMPSSYRSHNNARRRAPLGHIYRFFVGQARVQLCNARNVFRLFTPEGATSLAQFSSCLSPHQL